MAVEYGQKLGVLTSLDSGVSVSAGSSANGTGKDIGASSSPQPVKVSVQFSLTQAGNNDAADLQVLLQESDDNTNWPDDGEGFPIFSWQAGSVGEDLTRSAVIPFVPSLRYFRFHYINGNATDSFTVSAEVAVHTEQDDQTP